MKIKAKSTLSHCDDIPKRKKNPRRQSSEIFKKNVEDMRKKHKEMIK